MEQIDILRHLITFKSITPNSNGAIEYCASLLENYGFNVKVFHHNNVTNLYAKLENGPFNFCFAGHIDVVPAISDHWTYNPWELTESNGKLYGRGCNDMKGPLSCALVAIHDFIKESPNISISVALTSDEEIMSNDGMKSLVQELKNMKETINYCVLSESCSPFKSGEYIKIGCKGSLNIDLYYKEKQKHVAEGNNHLHQFIKILNNLLNAKFDNGSELFDPTRIQLTSINAANNVRNIIPSEISADFNIRFNNLWDHKKLEEYIKNLIPNYIDIKFTRFGYPFISASTEFCYKMKKIIENTINYTPQIGTSGGNSDALSLQEITQVVEIGTPLAQAHTVDEYILLDDLIMLRNIYFNILKYFNTNSFN